MNKLLYNCIIITQNKKRRVIPRGFIIFNKKIISVQEGHPSISQINKHEAYDLQGQIIAPGLINTHIHLGETIFRYLINKNISLESYLQETEKLYKKYPMIETQRNTICNYSLLISTLSGTSTICGGRVDKVANKWGIRNLSGFMVMNSNKLNKYYNKLDTLKTYPQAKTYISENCIFIHSLNTIEKNKLLTIKKIIKQKNKLMIHVAETEKSEKEVIEKWGDTSVNILNKYGLLTPQTLLIHGVFFTRNDIKLIKRNKSKVIHCPSSNILLSGKTLDLKLLLKNNIDCSIGTDGYATSNTLDILEEARRAYYIHKKTISTQTIFDLITINAARCIGWEKEIGSIEKNKVADFTIIETHSFPKQKNIISDVILNRQNVISGVIVNGRWILKNSKLVNGFNIKSIIKQYTLLEKNILSSNKLPS